MKPAVVFLAAALIFVLGTVASTFSQSPSIAPPPGVAPERWVPISDVAGVVLTDEPTPAFEGLPEDFRRPPDRSREGILMVNHNDEWIMFERLGELSPRFHQLR